MTDSTDQPEKKEKKVEQLYDPDSFIIPAQDTRGHKERLQFYVQPAHLNQVAAIVASKIFPFRTRGALMRWALDRGLKYLEEIAGNAIPSVTSQVDAIVEALRYEEFKKDLNRVIDLLSTQVTELLSKGDEEEAQ